jgi:hypothetical protein
MKYDHTKRSFQEAVDTDPDTLNELTKKAADLFNAIHGKRNQNRSEIVEAINKAIRGKTKKETALLTFFLVDMHNQQTYEMLGNTIGEIISQSMMKASEYGVPVPMVAPIGKAMGLGGIMEMMEETRDRKEEKDKKEKKQKSYGKNYIG